MRSPATPDCFTTSSRIVACTAVSESNTSDGEANMAFNPAEQLAKAGAGDRHGDA